MWVAASLVCLAGIAIVGSSMLRTKVDAAPYAPLTIHAVAVDAYELHAGPAVAATLHEVVCATQRTRSFVSISWSGSGAAMSGVSSLPVMRERGCTTWSLPVVAAVAGRWRLIVTETPIGPDGPGVPASAQSPSFTVL